MLKRWSLPLALLTVLALPVLAMAPKASEHPRCGTVRGLGHSFRMHAAVHRHHAASPAAYLASSLRQDLRLLGLAFLIPCLVVYGFNVAFYEFLHAILLEYIPFIVLLFALFTVAGGVRLKGSLVGTPVVNTGILAVGTILASWMGTTGAAMLLIRPCCAPMPTASTVCIPWSSSSSWWPTSAAP